AKDIAGFRQRGIGIGRNGAEQATHDLRAKLRALDSFAAARGGECGQSGKWRSLLEETRILTVAQPTGGKRRSGSGNFRGAAAQVDYSGVLRSHFGRGLFACV